MDRFRRFISDNLGEDEMEIDLDFTVKYLSQFESIDKQTIEVLMENGYQTKEHLLAFDLQEDLPQLPVLNMAQKSLLRRALKQFHESEELEIKINDLKGDDSQSPNLSIVDPISPPNKRKRDSGVHSLTKRLRSSPEKPNVSNDGLGTRMRQMVNKRKPIHRSNSQTDSDTEPELSTTVDPKHFQFLNNNQFNGFGRTSHSSSVEATYGSIEFEEDTEEPQVIEAKPLRGRRSQALTSPQELPIRASPLRGPPLRQSLYSLNEEVEQVVESKRLRGRRSQAVLPNPTPPRLSLTARKSVGSSFPVEVKSESKPTPKSSSRTSSHIPTPTELEVRERLAQKKASAQQKTGRKRR